MNSIFSSTAFRKKSPVLLIALAAAGCGNKQGAGKTEDFRVSGDTVTLSPYATVKARLRTSTVAYSPYSTELVSGATVKAIPNQYAEIAPPFSGRVTRVYLRLGMKTQPGTPLFEMTSPDFMEAQKAFLQAKTACQNAGRVLKRQQDLKANGVGAVKDLEEAETDFDMKEKEYQNALASLKIFKTDVQQLALGQPLVVRSPIAGEVVANDVVNGQYIKADDAPHAKVAELDKIWVVGMIKEKDLHLVRDLAGAAISLPAFPGRTINGKIFHVDEIMDEDTRSVPVLVACDNEDHALKPGMYVTVKFMANPQQSMFVAAKAVMQFNDKSYVWLQSGKDRYIKRYVQTGVTYNGSVQILSGLANGDIVVSEGAYYLSDAQ